MASNTKIEWCTHSASPWSVKGETRVVSKSFHYKCRLWNKQAEAAGVRASVFPSICDPFEDWQGPILGISSKIPKAETGRSGQAICA